MAVAFPSMPLQEPIIDIRSGAMSRAWIAWFEEYIIRINSIEFEQGGSGGSVGVQASIEDLRSETSASINSTSQSLTNIVEDLKTEVSQSNNISNQTLNSLEELETKFSNISSFLNKIETLEKLYLEQYRPPNLPFYLGSLVKFDVNGNLETNGNLIYKEKSSDPTDPAEGTALIWMSDGSATGDDGDLLYMEQSGGVVETGSLKWKDFAPASHTDTESDGITGAISTVQTMMDGNYMQIEEVSGGGGFETRFNFTNIDRYPGFILCRWDYFGGAGHDVTWDIYNYNTTAWDTVRYFTDTINTAYYDSMTMRIPLNIADDYVDGSGNAMVRVKHQSGGVATHYIRIDYVGLAHSLQGVI